MTRSDYYHVLGLPDRSTIEEIKKAYRIKARQYHPDINPDPDAKDCFIAVTEAYEFLVAYHDKAKSDDEVYRQAMEDWRKYRQEQARRRAYAYARTSYTRFRNTNFYKTTRIFDGTTVIFSLILSVILNLYIVFGYIYRVRHPLPNDDNPSFLTFILILAAGLTFLVVSLAYFKAFRESSKKYRKARNKMA
jgi:hypothetical protein